MMTLTAAEIAKLAFSGAIQASAGALSQVAIERAKKLWQKIREKFQGNPIAEKALKDAEKERTPEFLAKQVIPLLDIFMQQDPQFAEEIQNIARQINQEVSTESQKNITIGEVKATGSGAAAIGSFEGQAGDIGGVHTQEKK